jgi:hypothetical protein
MQLISFSCLIALARPPSTMLENSVRADTFIVTDLTKKTSSFSSLSMMLAIGFFFLGSTGV